MAVDLTALQDERIRRNLLREKARRHLMDFTTYTNTGYQRGWFNDALAAELTQFYADVEAGRNPRLIICAPPRHGKSEMFSRRFPAWAFGRNPDIEIIAASYAADLAYRMNGDVQSIMDDPRYQEVFPGARLAQKGDGSGAKRTDDLFEIVGRKGSYRAAGVRGGITGMGAHIAIIDDPCKDADEANSPTVRRRVIEWYRSTLYTRLAPKSGVLLGLTRWHVEDLAGHLLAEMAAGDGDTWRVVSFPAIAEVDEAHRRAGEALHPERYPLERLEQIKRAVGSQTWAALYQQRPTVLGGNIIRGAWFGRYTVLPQIKTRVIYVDTAQKTAERNDYSVFECWGLGQDGRLYLLDLLRGKWEAPELRRKAKDFWAKQTGAPGLPPVRRMKIEDKASGTGLIQDLKNVDRIPVEGIPRTTDKLTRVMDVVGYIESGYVLLPAEAPWVADFVTECEAFTADDSHAHDDQIDPLCDAISDLLASKPKGFFS